MKETNDKIFFVLFGSTGHLALTKILKSVEAINEKEPVDIIVFAVGRRNWSTNEYLNYVFEHTKISKQFSKNIRYINADISEDSSLTILKDAMQEEQEKLQLNNIEKIFFFATHFEFYKKITAQLSKLKLSTNKVGLTKAIFEKPFGEDLNTAKQINDDIKLAFAEEQIYRIDHYLGKEVVQDLLSIRQKDQEIQKLWNNEHIEFVKIILDESLDIGNRGQYYDKVGAIKDMLQNHILQIISLLFLDTKKTDIHNAKKEIISSIKNPNKKEIVIGQYEGYTNEQHVDKNSKTETLIALELEIDLKEYKGIPILVRTGKVLPQKNSQIYIKFKEHVQPLIIEIQPEKRVIFPHKEIIEHYDENSSEGYERLIKEVIKGDNTNFLRIDELEESWKFIDELNQFIKKSNIELIKYERGKIPHKIKELFGE
ncbi:hypothetical protein JXM83_03460 [Candidatus Woesearchaeota archaeon]|nr:hypothetical protein [Candidatus Woesearchaeota archaeon]